MSNEFIRKLGHFTRLSAENKAVLHELSREKVKTIPARFDVVREGDRPNGVYLVLDGWACRYKMMLDGRRHAMALLLPGDLCDLNAFIFREMDHSIAALTSLRYVEISRARLEAVMNTHQRIRHALWWEALVVASIQREWNVSLGRRNAFERLCSLFCELYYRLNAIGHAPNHSFVMPLTQADIAELTGLTPVHVNRTLQDLRAADLIIWQGKTLTIPNLENLEDAGLFSKNYLHLEREGQQYDANE